MLWVSDFTYGAIWAGIEPSLGSVGDSYDNALAETINDLYKGQGHPPAGTMMVDRGRRICHVRMR
jgi:transposase InsO family protein